MWLVILLLYVLLQLLAGSTLDIGTFPLMISGFFCVILVDGFIPAVLLRGLGLVYEEVGLCRLGVCDKTGVLRFIYPRRRVLVVIAIYFTRGVLVSEGILFLRFGKLVLNVFKLLLLLGFEGSFFFQQLLLFYVLCLVGGILIECFLLWLGLDGRLRSVVLIGAVICSCVIVLVFCLRRGRLLI